MKEIDPILFEAAKAARLQAYAPYSRFQVGAALRTKSGKVFFGANVENSSYGLSRCAEQSAVMTMVAAGEREISEIVVYTEVSPPASPCGACRQILFEFAPSAGFTCTNHLGESVSGQIQDLLPNGFRL